MNMNLRSVIFCMQKELLKEMVWLLWNSHLMIVAQCLRYTQTIWKPHSCL
uniref:Extra-large guanine nucleotide-binding protein 3 n=1 Tax=Rhizophora mucronata TaxID=61149 RepID=A0A2P2PJ41_RHIMU